MRSIWLLRGIRLAILACAVATAVHAWTDRAWAARESWLIGIWVLILLTAAVLAYFWEVDAWHRYWREQREKAEQARKEREDAR